MKEMFERLNIQVEFFTKQGVEFKEHDEYVEFFYQDDLRCKIYPNSTIRVENNKLISAYNNSEVEVYRGLKTRAFNNTKVRAHARSMVDAYHDSVVYAWGAVYLHAYDDTTVYWDGNNFDRSKMHLYDNARFGV